MVTAVNDITGDSIRSRTNNKAFEDNYDAIFRKKEPEPKPTPIAVEVMRLVSPDGIGGKDRYVKKMSDGTRVDIGRSEFMHLWTQLTGGCTYPNYPEDK